MYSTLYCTYPQIKYFLEKSTKMFFTWQVNLSMFCLKMTKAQACVARAAGQHKQNSMLAQQKLRSACTSVQSCQSPCQPLYASLEPRDSSAKTLIRSDYSGCVVWTESSQDTQVILYVLLMVSCALTHIRKGSPNELSFGIIDKV